MDDDASCRNPHPSAELQQSFAQHANLGAGASGASGPQAQLLQRAEFMLKDKSWQFETVDDLRALGTSIL